MLVADKVYILDIRDKSSADAFDKLAGRPLKGKGEARGDIIEDQSLAGAE